MWFKGNMTKNISNEKCQLSIGKTELFDGFLVNGKPDDHRIYLNSNKGIKYFGNWKHGKKHGNVCMRFDNQEIYNGEWFKDIAIGKRK